MSLIHPVCQCSFRTWLFFFYNFLFVTFSSYISCFILKYMYFLVTFVINSVAFIKLSKYFLLWIKNIQIIICIYWLYNCFMLSNFFLFSNVSWQNKTLKNMERSILSESNDRFDFFWNWLMNPLKSFKYRILFFWTPFSALKPVNRKYNSMLFLNLKIGSFFVLV